MAHRDHDHQEHAHDHAKGHAHDHAHAHGHEAHAHDEHHGHAHDPSAVVAPGPSLVRLSALERLAGAGVLSALIWLGVTWAMTRPTP